jgi:hypothetical protein
MKPIVIKILIPLLAAFILTSCGRRPSADDLAFGILKLYPSLPPCSQYIKNSEPYTSGYLSPEDFSYLYVGERIMLREWDMIEEFRLVLSNSTAPFEIHVIHLKTASDSDEIAKLLHRRASLLSYHNKTEEDYLVDEPLVIVKGKYAFLIVTHDNAAAEYLIEKML